MKLLCPISSTTEKHDDIHGIVNQNDKTLVGASLNTGSRGEEHKIVQPKLPICREMVEII